MVSGAAARARPRKPDVDALSEDRTADVGRRTETNEGECLDRANGEVGRVKS